MLLQNSNKFKNYSKFKYSYTFDQRLYESTKILNQYPDRIPIICEKSINGDNPEIDRHKYLVPKNYILGNFMCVIRKRIKLEPHEALFIFINNTIIPITSEIGEIYYKHRDPDGFLYVVYSKENIFG
jgi:GABA(A) receptor-associated protein